MDFKNTVIIMTTNLGTRDISKAVNLGFAGGHRRREQLRADEEKVNEELKRISGRSS